MALNLSPEHTAHFVELYGRENLLYDPSHKDYRNRGMRDAAIRNIAAELGVPGFGPHEVIAKFKNLRNSYSQELKKIEDSANRYLPKVHWFPIMNSYLRPFIQSRHSTLSNHKKARNERESTPVKLELDEDSRSSALNDIGHEYLTQSVNRWLPSDEVPVQANLDELPYQASRKRKLSSGGDNFMCRSDSHHSDLRDTTDSGVSAGAMDVYDHFGRYVSSLLREIGPPDSFLLQQEVTALILGRLKDKSFVKRDSNNTPSLD